MKTMKNRDVLRIAAGLSAVANIKGVKWNYAVARNLRTLEMIVQSLQDASKPPEAFMAYQKERIDLCIKHAVKDDDGKPQVSNFEYIIQDRVSFDVELKALQDQHADMISAREQQIEEYNELLEDSVDINLFLLSPDNIPEEVTGGQLAAIMEIIEE
ncbi:hypothetical protein LCGC14_0144970 [marine sediment metagenome]|uniref:Uncharacterized protein n=1 Tax=marine sediment metagenome TaxID=412755 RepID=A0A0F9UZN8_9ZZZZ